jgi:hypothetical protein
MAKKKDEYALLLEQAEEGKTPEGIVTDYDKKRLRLSSLLEQGKEDKALRILFEADDTLIDALIAQDYLKVNCPPVMLTYFSIYKLAVWNGCPLVAEFLWDKMPEEAQQRELWLFYNNSQERERMGKTLNRDENTLKTYHLAIGHLTSLIEKLDMDYLNAWGQTSPEQDRHIEKMLIHVSNFSVYLFDKSINSYFKTTDLSEIWKALTEGAEPLMQEARNKLRDRINDGVFGWQLATGELNSHFGKEVDEDWNEKPANAFMALHEGFRGLVKFGLPNELIYDVVEGIMQDLGYKGPNTQKWVDVIRGKEKPNSLKQIDQVMGR